MKFGFLKIGLLALSLSAPSLGAQDQSVGVPSAGADHCNFSGERFGQRFIVADFNNDQKPDSITLVSLGQHGGQNVFAVRVCDSGRAVSLLTFESNEPSPIVTAIDVNQDGSPDIVVEQRYTQSRIQVWLDNGHGGFHKANVADFANPDTRASCTVAALSTGRHSPSRAHVRRGKRLSIQTAKLPTAHRYSPGGYHWSFSVRVQKDLGGPNLSRAPPIALHL
ncbi:MAG TPA: VCBS repeat-containing protein [Terracidiphilus sp.]|nr:VCBS repeat-containing protein [Terracidiphilus sp.]